MSKHRRKAPYRNKKKINPSLSILRKLPLAGSIPIISIIAVMFYNLGRVMYIGVVAGDIFTNDNTISIVRSNIIPMTNWFLLLN